MPSPASPSRLSARNALQGTPYETIRAGRPPIPITVAPTPSSAQPDLHPSLRLNSESEPAIDKAVTVSSGEDGRRDSGLASSHSAAQESRKTLVADVDSSASVKKSQSLPRMARPTGGSSTPPATRKYGRITSGPKTLLKPDSSQQGISANPDIPLPALSTDIPTTNFEDLTSPGSIQFSKRGSILIGGKRASETYGRTSDRSNTQNEFQARGNSSSTARRTLSGDEEALSRRVRSMYESESSGISRSGSSLVQPDDPLEAFSAAQSRVQAIRIGTPSENPGVHPRTERDGLALTETFTEAKRELAGGIEDWEDLEGGDVDRYGFISLRAVGPSNVSSNSLPAASPARLHRVSTALQLASQTPRRRYSRLGRSSSVTKSTRSVGTTRGDNNGSRILRPLSSQSSYRSASSIRTSRLRIAANRLPHNRGRRIVDEAGNMLTLPPGLADIAEHEEGGRAADTQRRKEWERESKWRKMAKLEQIRGHGGGMVFSFDTTNPRLIERTWKGIPDRWRATAWHSFLSASAKKVPGSISDQDLIASFRELLYKSSPDDVQIDIDVPRTISGHVMFRKRYRGGQRLLFRVLHSLSLFFPDTGYVQGMAALAATLLCYFDEEMAFVMLVRMWQLRGLERLYQSGFEGLMQALQEFEGKWLKDGAVGTRLSEFGITPTAYGTRWYLTVFNYSIPFPAQLRVWDIFMLLGEPDPMVDASSADSFHGQLDALHATSAALIDATREILLDSDFENTMKVLTSWIPVRDEDMLLEVAKTEWKAYRKRRRSA